MEKEYKYEVISILDIDTVYDLKRKLNELGEQGYKIILTQGKLIILMKEVIP